MGAEAFPTILDAALYDANGKPLLGELAGAPTKHVLNDYAVDANWDDTNGSGVVFRGISDAGNNPDMPMTSWNLGEGFNGSVDFAHVTVVSDAYAHPSWSTLADVGRAFLRGLGYTVSAPAVAGAPAAASSKSLTSFSFANPLVVGTIDQGAGTIRLVVPYQTALQSLVATFSFQGSSVTGDDAGKTLLGAEFDGGAYTSSDQGATWVKKGAPSRKWTNVTTSADGSKLAAFIRGDGLCTSSDSGATWTYRDGGAHSWTDAGGLFGLR